MEILVSQVNVRQRAPTVEEIFAFQMRTWRGVMCSLLVSRSLPSATQHLLAQFIYLRSVHKTTLCGSTNELPLIQSFYSYYWMLTLPTSETQADHHSLGRSRRPARCLWHVVHFGLCYVVLKLRFPPTGGARRRPREAGRKGTCAVWLLPITASIILAMLFCSRSRN